MTTQSVTEFSLLRDAYRAFNSRNIDAALVLMTPDVAWPRAFKSGFVEGPEAVRAYWTEQWREISPQVEPVSFHKEGSDRVLVEVHQVVRDMTGSVLVDEYVGHRFTTESDTKVRKLGDMVDGSGGCRWRDAHVQTLLARANDIYPPQASTTAP